MYFAGTLSFLNHACTVFLCTPYISAARSNGISPLNLDSSGCLRIKSFISYTIFIVQASNCQNALSQDSPSHHQSHNSSQVHLEPIRQDVHFQAALLQLQWH